MITEGAVLGILELETYQAGTWTPWLMAANTLTITRGGKRTGARTTVGVGTLSATLINAGDPLAGSTLKPNLPIRLSARLTSEPVFTGRIVDIGTSYVIDKTTGETTTVVAVTAADAVAAHVQTIRYGAVTPGAVGFETWANRIIRLSASSTTTTNPPVDDSPIVRYGI